MSARTAILCLSLRGCNLRPRDSLFVAGEPDWASPLGLITVGKMEIAVSQARSWRRSPDSSWSYGTGRLPPPSMKIRRFFDALSMADGSAIRQNAVHEFGSSTRPLPASTLAEGWVVRNRDEARSRRSRGRLVGAYRDARANPQPPTIIGSPALAHERGHLRSPPGRGSGVRGAVDHPGTIARRSP